MKILQEKYTGIYFQLSIFILLFSVRPCFAQEIKQLPAFSREDRVLILAPHPDDEAIGVGGLMQRALKAGARVRITLLTNGDNNEFAFIVYEKRLTFKKKEFLHMGEIRGKETKKAMGALGISQNDILFLGYPDFGTMEILTRYWGKTKPFRSMLPRVTKVSYPDAVSYSAPFVGESILKDLKKIIVEYKPTMIFVSHPADTNKDHRAFYLFLKIALWDLEGKIKQPQIFPYIIHVVGWPKPRGYYPDLELLPPMELERSEISWLILALTEDEIKKKCDTIAFYKSQIKCCRSYLLTFARKTELFGDFPEMHLKEGNTPLEWQNQAIPEKKKEREKVTIEAPGLSYIRQGNSLVIKLALKRTIDKNFGISIFLLGYRKDRDFSLMPKIYLSLGIGGLRIKDKRQTLFIKDVQLKHRGKTLYIKVPLNSLGNPERILTCARTNARDLPLDDTAWRILSLAN